MKEVDAERFETLVRDVQGCTTCKRMCDSKRVLNRGCGPLSASVLVIGEAPGRLGADASELPFHGDRAGHNFEALIELAGMGRSELFITNAVLCNPKDANGNNSTPTETEIANCASFLKRQIDLVNPKIVVTLGAIALRATACIEPHKLVLKDSVRTSSAWYGRELVPLYHPGQRAMLHRSFANQTADYQFLAERVRRLGKSRPAATGRARPVIARIAAEILARSGRMSYFSLHKLAYLAEYIYSKKFATRMTDAYYVRQKDGPYCVDLHPERLKRAGVAVKVISDSSGIWVSSTGDLFNLAGDGALLDADTSSVLDEVFARYASLSDARLKTATYLTRPMRDILQRERNGSNQFNAPITF